MKRAIVVVFLGILLASVAYAVTAAELNQNREHLQQHLANKSEAEILSAIEAGIVALSNGSERNAFADAFATSIGFDKVDTAIPTGQSVYVENARKMFEALFVDPDAAWAAAKTAALAASELKPVEE